MNDRHRGGPDRHPAGPDDFRDHPRHSHHARHHGEGPHPHGGGRRGHRLFDYGELRLLLLAMIAERPSHGYELIKAVEERFGGSYVPSPGVIYPTLAWLDDMGYAAIDPEIAGRKRYGITAEGEAFLSANRAAADDLLARAAMAGEAGGRHRGPPPVMRAMENLKTAMRLRMRQGSMDEDTIRKIAAALDAAAQAVERS
jgi:DNA-binding PadR family transcriptional regulator